jgi:hypothetical protein
MKGGYWSDRILILNFKVGEAFICLFVNGKNNTDGKVKDVGEGWVTGSTREFTEQRKPAEHWWND